MNFWIYEAQEVNDEDHHLNQSQMIYSLLVLRFRRIRNLKRKAELLFRKQFRHSMNI